MQPLVRSSPSVDMVVSSLASGATAVELVIDESRLAALRPAWNSIAAQRPDLSVFGWHEWFDAAWQWRKDACRLHVLTWSEHGELRAVLPMLMRTAGPLAGIRELSFLTVPDTQFCDILVADADRAQAVAAFASYLRARAGEWDVMRLGFLRPESAAATTFASALGASGFAIARETSPGNPFISLQGDWDTYYDSRSRRLKKASNLAANRLHKAGEARIEWLTPGTGKSERLASLLEDVVEVSRNSWKSDTGTTLDQPAPGAFIRRLSTLAAERGWLSIWLLTLDGRPMATEYQLVHQGMVHALRSDFRQGHEEISPGSHLNRNLLEQLFGRGYRQYYMGPGNNAYKYRWSEGSDPQASMTIYGRTVAGRILRAWEHRLRPWASAVKARLVARVETSPGEQRA